MALEPDNIKTCCSAFYGNTWMAKLLGDAWHPGGLALTERMGRELRLTARDTVLDVASGQGASARFLAERFGCRVIGIDYGAEQVARAAQKAQDAGLAQRLTFYRGDAEALPVDASSVDAVVCECALCTFPSPEAAVREWARVLRPQGRLGLSDVTRKGTLPAEVEGLMGWVACLSGSRTTEGYAQMLQAQGFLDIHTEQRGPDLAALLDRIERTLLAWSSLGNFASVGPRWSAEAIGDVARSVRRAIDAGDLGYCLITARRP